MMQEEGQVIKAKLGDQEFSYTVPKGFFKHLGVANEEPHIHHSKPHPSKNDKYCDICQKQTRKHYHVCEQCFNFLKESHIKTIQEMRRKLDELEKRLDKREA